MKKKKSYKVVMSVTLLVSISVMIGGSALFNPNKFSTLYFSFIVLLIAFISTIRNNRKKIKKDKVKFTRRLFPGFIGWWWFLFLLAIVYESTGGIGMVFSVALAYFVFFGVREYLEPVQFESGIPNSVARDLYYSDLPNALTALKTGIKYKKLSVDYIEKINLCLDGERQLDKNGDNYDEALRIINDALIKVIENISLDEEVKNSAEINTEIAKSIYDTLNGSNY